MLSEVVKIKTDKRLRLKNRSISSRCPPCPLLQRKQEPGFCVPKGSPCLYCIPFRLTPPLAEGFLSSVRAKSCFPVNVMIIIMIIF